MRIGPRIERLVNELKPSNVWFGISYVLFCSAFMKKNQQPYSILQLASAVFMMLALLWLTISLPYVYASQQEWAELNNIENTGTPLSCTEEETCNPMGNTTEEKNPSSTSLTEEYLHDHHGADHFFSIDTTYHKLENADTYTAFHGEVQVPPPNVA